jgi:hypothetical protein
LEAFFNIPYGLGGAILSVPIVDGTPWSRLSSLTADGIGGIGFWYD